MYVSLVLEINRIVFVNKSKLKIITKAFLLKVLTYFKKNGIPIK